MVCGFLHINYKTTEGEMIMSMLNPAVAAPIAPITVYDVAAKLNMKPGTVRSYLAPGCKTKSAAVNRVREAAKAMGYNPKAVVLANHEHAVASVKSRWQKTPANKVFASREAETKAMLTLRSEGYSNQDIAVKCGVCHTTVSKRIGAQPAIVTKANHKLGQKIRSAKIQLRKGLAQEQRIREYNAKVEAFNAEAAKLMEQYQQLKKMKPASKNAALSITPIQKLH